MFLGLGVSLSLKSCPCPHRQWESQHAGLTCEQFQAWKRENDPEYQRQGLAGYLRDNGISECVCAGCKCGRPEILIVSPRVTITDLYMIRRLQFEFQSIADTAYVQNEE